MKGKELLDRLLAVIYPYRCVLCNCVVCYEDDWCGKCDLDRIGKTEIPHIAEGMSALQYGGNVRSAILTVKNKGEHRSVRFFAEQMLQTLHTYCKDIHFDGVVPVPTSQKRLKMRGFNQTELLAEIICNEINVPMRCDVLFRQEDSKTQHQLTAAERKINTEGAYALQDAAAVSGMTLLLIDDVLTTGATLSACAAQLMQAGADQVYALTACKTVLASGE